MKAVILSIRPEWCNLIIRGQKTLEVRRTRPKLETPFKVYIYCTKAPQQLITIFKDGEETMDGEIHHGNPVFVKFDKLLPDSVRGKTQMVVGEFVCDKIDKLVHVGTMIDINILTLDGWYKPADALLQAACLTEETAKKYLQGRNGYGWHISDLKIYDQPRELRAFTGLQSTRFGMRPIEITRPPQSWRYVEDGR